MHSTPVLGEVRLAHHRRMQWREAGRDAMIVAVCVGTVDFVLVFEGSKIFWFEGGWIPLWASIVGLNLIALGAVLAVFRPVISPSKGFWFAWLVVLGVYGGEWFLRDSAPFSDLLFGRLVFHVGTKLSKNRVKHCVSFFVFSQALRRLL